MILLGAEPDDEVLDCGAALGRRHGVEPGDRVVLEPLVALLRVHGPEVDLACRHHAMRRRRWRTPRKSKCIDKVRNRGLKTRIGGLCDRPGVAARLVLDENPAQFSNGGPGVRERGHAAAVDDLDKLLNFDAETLRGRGECRGAVPRRKVAQRRTVGVKAAQDPVPLRHICGRKQGEIVLGKRSAGDALFDLRGQHLLVDPLEDAHRSLVIGRHRLLQAGGLFRVHRRASRAPRHCHEPENKRQILHHRARCFRALPGITDNREPRRAAAAEK